MSSAQITSENVLKRHPNEAAALLKNLKADDATQIDWSYSLAVRIDGRHAPRQDKGINVLRRNPDAHIISLVAKSGRKRSNQPLDVAGLLTGDPALLPVELFEYPKPAGPTVYVWQPNREASPGWNEAVVTRLDIHPRKGDIALQAVTDDGQTHFLERDVHGKWGQSAGGVGGKGWRKGTDEELSEVINSLEQGYLPANEVSIADLLMGLGMGEEEAEYAANISGKEQAASLPNISGARWAWGEQISDEELLLYTRLVSSKSGPSSGNFLEVFGGHFNPANQLKDTVARAVLLGLAEGRSADDAAREAISSQTSLPKVPDGEIDIVAHIEANAEAGARSVSAPIRPFVLR